MLYDSARVTMSNSFQSSKSHTTLTKHCDFRTLGNCGLKHGLTSQKQIDVKWRKGTSKHTHHCGGPANLQLAANKSMQYWRTILMVCTFKSEYIAWGWSKEPQDGNKCHLNERESRSTTHTAVYSSFKTKNKDTAFSRGVV